MRVWLSLILVFISAYAVAANVNGRIFDADKKLAIEAAVVTLPERRLWSVTNDKGEFVINNVPEGNHTVIVTCLGYKKTEFSITVTDKDNNFLLNISPDNLALEEVVVTAKENKYNSATSYVIDSKALEHQQVTAVTDITSLLPGGKTAKTNNLTSGAKRFEIRSESGELGNPTFMTAVEIDGLRLSNNATMSGVDGTRGSFNSLYGTDTRNIQMSNIESVEVITGIPSVEYGDVAGGMVLINTKKGYTPFDISFSSAPGLKSASVSKGFDLGSNAGHLNFGLESSTSTADIASPYTKYSRNGLTISYNNTIGKGTSTPFIINAGVSGNVGGYNSKSDPDNFTDTYTRQKDNAIRAHAGFDWMINKPYLTRIEAKAYVNYADKEHEVKTNKSSSTSTLAFHGTEEGYFIATDFEKDPEADISLIPAGYWYETEYCQDRPIEYGASLKLNHNLTIGRFFNKIKVGANFSTTGNLGRGIFYDDPLYTPTWREYRFDEIPFMKNGALYAEDNLTFPLGNTLLQLNGGIRYDVTKVDGSDYGTTSALSPRFSGTYTIIDNPYSFVSNLKLRGGIGESVKLPAFSVLYPDPSYAQRLTFAPGALADGTIYYAYYIMPSERIYNPDLKMQRTRQMEIGGDIQLGKVKISLNAYRNRSYNGYTLTNQYTPYSYKFTDQRAIEGTSIPVNDRQYYVDRETGIVTMYDKNGIYSPAELEYSEKKTYKSNSTASNISPILREGLEWIADIGRIKSIYTSFRLDGNFYHYKGVNEELTSYLPTSSQNMANGDPYKYIGIYAGSNGVSGVSNGSETRKVNLNLTATTNIPKIKLLVSLRVESTLYHSTRYLSEYNGKSYGRVLSDRSDYIGSAGDIYGGDSYVAVYPVYYTSYDDMTTLIPFEEKFLWARENDTELYNELAKLVSKSNTSYYFNRNKLSPYFTANLTVSKEIGKHFLLSFYANNFLNNLGKVTNSWNNNESSLFNSSYIPSFNYGLSLKIKI